MLNTTISIIFFVTIIFRIKKLKTKHLKEKQILQNLKEKYDKTNKTNKIGKIKKLYSQIKTNKNIDNYSNEFVLEIITKLESGMFFQKAWDETLNNFLHKHKYSKQLDDTINKLHTICAYTHSLGANTTKILTNIKQSLETKRNLEIEKEISLTPARTTIKILSTLPIFAIMLGFILGVNTIQILTQNQSGNICLILGLLLYSIGQIWVKNIKEKTMKPPIQT